MVSKTKKTQQAAKTTTRSKSRSISRDKFSPKRQSRKTQKNNERYQWHFKIFSGYTSDERAHITKVLKGNIVGRKFKRGELLMAKSSDELSKLDIPFKYRRSKQYHNMLFSFTFLHHGQRKLFNTELYLFSKYLSRHTDNANVVYAGAAAGVHFPYLASLFPNIHFHLYDPAKFAIKETTRIHIYNEFYTDDISASWAPGGKMHAKWGSCDFFLCDIRVDISEKSDEDREAQVTEDMQRQQKWAQLIQPAKASMLKFRPPYDSNAILEYLPGQILWQTWPGKASGETRLITESKQFKDGLTKYNVGKYEDACAVHNIVDRTYARYTDIRLFGLVPGYNGSWDSRAEAETWKMYLDIVPGVGPTTLNIAKKMNALTRALHQPLNPINTYHGRYSQFIRGNKWLWMITRELQKIDRKKLAAKRNKHEIQRVKGLGVKGYMIKK